MTEHFEFINHHPCAHAFEFINQVNGAGPTTCDRAFSGRLLPLHPVTLVGGKLGFGFGDCKVV